MTTNKQRLVLTILAAFAASTGVWAYLSPRSWYARFPDFGVGISWLPQLGPYNEHFCTDVGATFLALMALSITAIVLVDNAAIVRVVAIGWLTFNLLHMIYHLTMLHMYNTRDQVLNVVTLGAAVLISAALLIPPHASKPPAA